MNDNANIFDELKWRGLIYDAMDGVEELLAKEKIRLYNGFDPTADSLHVGHMVPMIALARFQRFGHHVIALAGEGTGMIGDPSGRSAERNLLTAEEAHHNVEEIKKQLAHFLDFEIVTNPARIVNNGDWLMNLKLVDFLRDIGKHFTINMMLTKDSVKNRMGRESGLSYTEFSYSLLQSYDFLHLYETENCVLQTGGSDQWGNITAGCELIRKKIGKNAYGLTYPLVKKKDGSKFGKTAGGAVWLNPDRTSPYKFYQFWLNANDADVIDFLKFFTFFDQETILGLESETREKPESRTAQKTLAKEMTMMMHGQTALDKAVQASEALFGGEISGLSSAEVKEIFAEVPSFGFNKEQFTGDGKGIVDLLTECGFLKSKGEARRAITEGGIYVNNHRVDDSAALLPLSQFIEGKYLVLRRGKKNYFIIETK
ncbi:MAG: tyrosine--tRNA ligase [Flexilinea sp.]